MSDEAASAATVVGDREGARASAWAAVTRQARRALLDATRDTLGRAATPLAKAYAVSRRARADDDAVADGLLLGAASLAPLLRELAALASGANRLTTLRGAVVARRGFLERVATPRTRVRVMPASSSPTPHEPAQADESVVVSTSDAPAIAMSVALRELFARDRPTTLVVAEALRESVASALAPLTADDHLRIEAGDVERAADLAGERRALVAIAPAGERAPLAARLGSRLEGRAAGAPSLIAISPFLFGRDEIGILADHVASELLAPPAPTVGVHLLLGRGWLQRDVLLDRLDASLRARVPGREGPPVGAPGERTWLVEGAPPPGRAVVGVTETLSDDPVRHLGGLSELAPAADEAVTLLSVLTHPMLRERPAFAAALDALSARAPVDVLGVDTRASLAFSLGGPAMGPSAHLDSWMFQYPRRIYIDAALRLRVPSGLRASSRRARFELAPSLGAAVALGAASLLVNVP